MSASPPAIDVRVDRFVWEDHVLFDGLQVRFAGGRCSCLLGASGCGKTTLLRIMAGLLPAGRATLTDGSSLRGRVAYMAQSDLLLPWLTVEENLTLGSRLRGDGRVARSAARDRARMLLQRVGLGERAAARPAELSGGMRQRAALARTLVEDRPIVLMDEPFSALDAITRHRLQDLAAELLAGRTVVLVTHSPLEAVRLGYELFVMSGDGNGRASRIASPIRLEGSPPRDPRDARVATLQGRLLDELALGARVQDCAA